jgi:hypothetical protein
MKIKSLIGITLAFFLAACGDKMNEVPMDKFIGLWELKGRGVFEGIQIRIDKQGEKLNGKIVKLNDNKLVKIFADNGDTWVSEIARSSNYQFKLTEKKLAKDLFSLYGLSTSQEFKVEFIDDNTIGLAADGSDPQHATIIYKRAE